MPLENVPLLRELITESNVWLSAPCGTDCLLAAGGQPFAANVSTSLHLNFVIHAFP